MMMVSRQDVLPDPFPVFDALISNSTRRSEGGRCRDRRADFQQCAVSRLSACRQFLATVDDIHGGSARWPQRFAGGEPSASPCSLVLQILVMMMFYGMAMRSRIRG
jgi:hypothetical protein